MTELGQKAPRIRHPFLADALDPLAALALPIAASPALYGFTDSGIVHAEPALDRGGAP
jgi:hypothetical protein